MDCWHFYVFTFALLINRVHSAVIPDADDVAEQGLYSESDHVIVLTQNNFGKKIYGQKHALLVQFYNSYCGHCRAFAPKYKTVASEIQSWKNIFRLGALDCSNEDNNGLCREFEIFTYPSFRYFHESYVKGNENIGETLMLSTDNAATFKAQLIAKLRAEQSMGHLKFAPLLNIASYSSYASAVRNIPNDVIYTFLVFENLNSTVGSELALDINDYEHIRVERVYDTSELAHVAELTQFPGLLAVSPKLETTLLTPKNPTKLNMLRAINTFLKSKNVFPVHDQTQEINPSELSDEKPAASKSDVIYYGDLEKTIKVSLHTEITKYKRMSGEVLQALMDYLNVLITNFPSKRNLKEYLVDLRDHLSTRSEWDGSVVSDMVKRLENVHAPVYSPNVDYISCKGSQPHFRGYTCGLWSLFHTLTVNAAHNPGKEGPKILRALYGYVTNFFGCTDCVEHFKNMSAKNRIFDVKENDKAVLWLWISHNEVNLRLAGTTTEDPEHPKIQYPSILKCRECRKGSAGIWNLPAVYQYLESIYLKGNIRDQRKSRSSATAPSPFSNLDIGMLSLLYILSFFILVLVIKFFLSKRFYRKRLYKHGRGKV